MDSVQEKEISENEEAYYSEIILYDVLHIIFGFLNIYDLNQAAKVCKSWYHAAKIEKLKRGPQVMILQALEDFVATGFVNSSPVDENEIIDEYKQTLRIKPSVGLFFTDGKYPPTADCDSVTYEICVAHQWTQPEDCVHIAIEALGVGVDNRAVGGERNITAALFFPKLSTVNYAFFETSSHRIEQYFQNSSDSLLTDLTNKLFIDAEHVCFMIFIYQWKQFELAYQNNHNNFLTIVLDHLKTRYKHGTYTLWGGAIDDIFMLTIDTKPSYHSTSFSGISIAGSSVKSWSVNIKINLTDYEIQEKLLDFKSSIKLKSSSIAFLILPTEEEIIDRSKINIFKDIFPTVKLLSIFNNKNHVILSTDSTCNKFDPDLKHSDCYAYLILTYELL